jgi:O-phosphoseryl-tRNA(Sec) kinase
METQKRLKSCILLICGLPSSGKTLLTNNLLNYSKLNPFLMNEKFVFYNISVDQLIPIEDQSIRIQINGFWKQFRNDLLIASKLFVKQLLIYNNSDNDTKDSIHFNPNVLSIYESIKRLNNYNEKSFDNFVLIIDDNFYYKSMRYEWFLISKQFHMGFAIVMINCPLDLAIQSNQRRSHDKCVPNSVIIKMNERFERPQMIGFELRTFTIPTHCFDFVINDDLIDFIIDAIRNPIVKQNMINEELREHSKILNQSNLIHRVDCLLREIINQRIVESLNKREIAKKLNEAKKSVLNDLKQSDDILPTFLTNEIVKSQSIIHNYNEIKLFLNDLLDKRINLSES